MLVPFGDRTVFTDHGLPRLGYGPISRVGIGVDKLAAIQARDLGDKKVVFRQVVRAVDARIRLNPIDFIEGGLIAVFRAVKAGQCPLQPGDLGVDRCQSGILASERGKLGGKDAVLRFLHGKLASENGKLSVGCGNLLVGDPAHILELFVNAVKGVQIVGAGCRRFFPQVKQT